MQYLPEKIGVTEEIIEEKPLKVTSVNARWLRQGALRLDGSHYAEEAFQAKRVLEGSSYPIEPLENLTRDIFMLPLKVKIPLAADDSSGAPYLMQSELYYFRPMARKYIFPSRLDEPDKWRLKEGWVIVSQSGNVGIPLYVSRRLESFFVSPNPLRLLCNERILPGYLYAYLSSRIGHPLVVRDKFGGTVDHLLPHHLKALPVPLIPEEQRRQIHDKVVRAYRLRDEANDLLDKAEVLLYEELGLPKFSENEAQYLHPEAKGFSTKVGELRLRLDASYHTPLVRLILEKLKKGKYPLTAIGDPKISKRVFIPPRFKRIYVRQKHGVPFLQGTHIVEMKPYDLKYISQKFTQNLHQWILRAGWVLVTCSGTIGRVTLTPDAWDDWAASQHILRVVPNETESNPGYIAAFLSSPFGYHQVVAGSYGAVVSEITAEHLSQVSIPLPPREVQGKIGNPVLEAYEKKEEANQVEDEAVKMVEDVIRRGATNGQ